MQAEDPNAWIDRVYVDTVARPLVESARLTPGQPASPGGGGEYCPACHQRSARLLCAGCHEPGPCLPCVRGGMAGGWFCLECQVYRCEDCLTQVNADSPTAIAEHMQTHLDRARQVHRVNLQRHDSEIGIGAIAFAACFFAIGFFLDHWLN